MNDLKQKISNVYVTLGDIEIKGSQAKAYALCLQALEECIVYIDSQKQEETNKE